MSLSGALRLSHCPLPLLCSVSVHVCMEICLSLSDHFLVMAYGIFRLFFVSLSLFHFVSVLCCFSLFLVAAVNYFLSACGAEHCVT